jgi:hypothetical protein
MSSPDTAQAYRNEAEVGKALRESGLTRKDVFITTKFSGLDGLDVETSIQNSLKNVSAIHFFFFVFVALTGLNDSWGSITWIYISFITQVLPSLIFLRPGRRWRSSKQMDWPSVFSCYASLS